MNQFTTTELYWLRCNTIDAIAELKRVIARMHTPELRRWIEQDLANQEALLRKLDNQVISIEVQE